jgi:hypothetical protein
MKKTLLAIALGVAMLPVMSFAQVAPDSGTPAPTTKTKKRVHKAKHAKKAKATSAVKQ